MIALKILDELQGDLLNKTNDRMSAMFKVGQIIGYEPTDTSVETTIKVLQEKLLTYAIVKTMFNDKDIERFYVCNIHFAFKNLIDMLETQKYIFDVYKLTNIIAGNHFLDDYGFDANDKDALGRYDAKEIRVYLNGICLPYLTELMYLSDDLYSVVSKLSSYLVCKE